MKIFFLILIIQTLIVGCTSKYESLLINNISEARQFIYVGEVDGIKTSFVCGCRESEYVANGVSTPLIDFGVITFKLPKDIELNKSIAQYVLSVGTSRYDGLLETNPFDGSLVADIGKVVSKNDVASVKIIAGEFVKNIPLTLISDDWKVQYLDVIDIACKNYKNELRSFVKDNIFRGEVYIKMIEGEDENYYWYFNVISMDGQNISLLISTSGELLTSNVNINKIN